MAVVKRRQCSFYRRLLPLNEEDAIARRICSLHRHLSIITYYEGLDLDVVKRNKTERVRKSHRGTTTYVARYHEIFDMKYNHIIYDSFIPEKCRIMTTRWRVSCHNLKIETGRRDLYIELHLHLCVNCATLEDEAHVVYICFLYDTIRYLSITTIFNPVYVYDAVTLGNYLTEIECYRENLVLN